MSKVLIATEQCPTRIMNEIKNYLTEAEIRYSLTKAPAAVKVTFTSVKSLFEVSNDLLKHLNKLDNRSNYLFVMLVLNNNDYMLELIDTYDY